MSRYLSRDRIAVIAALVAPLALATSHPVDQS